jgi:hypothetical protein
VNRGTHRSRGGNLTRVRAGDSPARSGESEQVQAFTVGEV